MIHRTTVYANPNITVLKILTAHIACQLLPVPPANLTVDPQR